MRCSGRLRAGHGRQHGRWYQWSERAFERVQNFYRRSLSASLRHQPIVLGVFFALVIATVILGAAIKKGFLPNDDTGQLFVFTQAAQDIGYDAMVAKQREAAAIIRRDPNVDNVLAFMGAGGSTTSIIAPSARSSSSHAPASRSPRASTITGWSSE